MIPVAHQKLCQIVVTNKCTFNCCHCSQMCPLVPENRKYFMSLEQIENALKSLEDYPGHIGMFGGEPTLHPEFREICKLYQKWIPVKARRELWTNGLKWKQYEDIINETFYRELVAYNEHEVSQPCWHQPVNIGLEEVSKNLFEKLTLRENCWVQQRWSSAITPMGAYFCEVASAREYILNRWNGLQIETGWWKRPLSDFQYQLQSCDDCSMCIPMPQKVNDNQEWDDVSCDVMYKLTAAGSNKKMLPVDIDKLRKFICGHEFVPQSDYQKRGGFVDFPEWTPWKYRPLIEKKHCPRKT